MPTRSLRPCSFPSANKELLAMFWGNKDITNKEPMAMFWGNKDYVHLIRAPWDKIIAFH